MARIETVQVARELDTQGIDDPSDVLDYLVTHFVTDEVTAKGSSG